MSISGSATVVSVGPGVLVRTAVGVVIGADACTSSTRTDRRAGPRYAPAFGTLPTTLPRGPSALAPAVAPPPCADRPILISTANMAAAIASILPELLLSPLIISLP